jgi:hypothetical protein
MSFGGFDSGNRTAPMAEINTTPLVDVMLVLLIIFIITAPLLTHAVRIDLPEASSTPNSEKPETVTLAIDADGKLFWNDQPIAEGPGTAARRGRRPQPAAGAASARGQEHALRKARPGDGRGAAWRDHEDGFRDGAVAAMRRSDNVH